MMYIYISHGRIVGQFIRYDHSKTVIFDVYSDTMNTFDIKKRILFQQEHPLLSSVILEVKD